MSFEPMFALLNRLAGDSRDTLLAMYAQALDSQLPLMRQALDDGDMLTAQNIAHKMAGSSSMLQDVLLFKTARAVESPAGEGDISAARLAWPALELRAQVTLDAILRGW